MPYNDEIYNIIGADYDPNYYDPKPAEAPRDPTLKALNESGAKGFLSYPNELTQVENPGHFILFQAFEVEGIRVDDIVSGVRNLGQELIGLDAFDTQSVSIPGGGAVTVPVPNFDRISGTIVNTGLDIFGNGVLASDEAALRNQSEDNTLASRLYGQNLNSASNVTGVQVSKKDLLGKRKTLKDTIALYMPENIATSYSFDYASENTVFSSGVRAVVDWANNPTRGNFRQGVRDIKNYLISSKIELGKSAVNLFGADISGQIAPITRMVLNPYLEMMFKQVNMRSFSYSFNFFPRNISEVTEVYDIIKKFKFHAHPVYDTKSTFLAMPSEFEIVFYSGNKENKYINRVLPCVLTSIDINYSPNGQIAFFKDLADNGQSPVQIQMTLNFTESGLLHRDHIEENY